MASECFWPGCKAAAWCGALGHKECRNCIKACTEHRQVAEDIREVQ